MKDRKLLREYIQGNLINGKEISINNALLMIDKR